MSISPDILAREILDVVPVIMRTIRSEMSSHRTADLTVPQFRTLMFLNRNPGSALLDVSKHLGLTSPTVCKMVDGMVSNRLVTRESSSADRRKVILTLTPDGQVILEKARGGTQARLAEFLSALTPDERESILQAMRRVHSLFSPGSASGN